MDCRLRGNDRGSHPRAGLCIILTVNAAGSGDIFQIAKNCGCSGDECNTKKCPDGLIEKSKTTVPTNEVVTVCVFGKENCSVIKFESDVCTDQNKCKASVIDESECSQKKGDQCTINFNMQPSNNGKCYSVIFSHPNNSSTESLTFYCD